MMNKPIDNQEKLRILEHVLQSDDFRKAKKYRELLHYLVEQSIRCEEIKESTIAFEFFDKHDAFDPSVDSTVRAYVSNLRRKLEHYYLTEGQSDEIQIVLPKGDYRVDFIPLEMPQPAPHGTSYKLPFLILAPISIVLGLLVIWLGLDKLSRDRTEHQFVQKNDPVWHDILESDKKSLIVLGDYYFFSMPLDSGRHSYLRDVRINSDDDLTDFLHSHPAYESKISKTYHTYLDEHIPWSLFHILPLLVRHNKDIELKLASEVQLEDLQKYNMIYVGPYKSLNVLSTVVRELDFKYYPDRIEYFDRAAGKLFTYAWAANPETQARNDYAIVLKVSGANDNTLMFFLSQHDFGNTSTAKHFADPEYLKQIGEKIPSNYFEALFEVKGIVRTDFEIKLLHVNQLSNNFQIRL